MSVYKGPEQRYHLVDGKSKTLHYMLLVLWYTLTIDCRSKGSSGTDGYEVPP